MSLEHLVHWARLAGENALPLFLLALALVLAATWATGRAVKRYPRPSDRTALPPLPYLLSRVALGFVVIVAGGGVFAELADELDTEGELARIDLAFTESVQRQLPAWALATFAAVTRLGDPVVLVAVGTAVGLALFLRGKRAWTLAWSVVVIGGALLNVSLKQVFERVRPLHADGPVIETGFSFPSGHSTGAVVVYGMLAYLAQRALPQRWHLPLMLVAAALAFSVGASRAFLRVHYVSDVVAGFAFGAAWLAVCILSIELTRWWRRRPGTAR